MNRMICLLVCMFLSVHCFAQELNATVNINYNQIGNSNQGYFKTLEKSMKDLLNTTSWSGRNLSGNQKIDCVFLLNISNYSNNIVSGTLQIQSSRPIYNSTYSSSVLNFNDRDISFSYVEFENLYYNPSVFESNLVSILGFYANLIIGLDQDTFSLEENNIAYQNALTISSVAQQSNYKGWKQGDGNNNRYYLINDLLAANGNSYRSALYNYHRLGLDIMATDLELGRDGIFLSLQELEKMHRIRANSFLMRVFFDAKTDEIEQVYFGITDKNKKNIVQLLNKLSPLSGAKWNNL